MSVETCPPEQGRKRSELEPAAGPPRVDVVCTQCNQVNAGPRTFCGGCGQRLWERCPSCQGWHRTGERFCGHCGTDFDQRRLEIRQQDEQQLAAAEACHQAGDLPRALQLLKALDVEQDSVSQELAQRVASLRERIERDQQQWQQTVKQSEHEAARLVAAHRYREAVDALERIPEPFRSEQARHYLREATSRRDEIEQVTKDLQTLVRGKQREGLAPRIDRLLELQPGHAWATKLAEQLAARLLAAVKLKLEADDYAAALGLLDQLPRAVPSPEADRLREQATELNWLLEDLKLAPVIDPPLVAVAERLVQLRPNHPQAGRLLQAVRARAAQRPKDPRHAAPAWAPPQDYRLGFPIHGWAGLQRIGCAAELQSRLQQEPGQFFVACGLALQGLGLAAIDINLLPRAESGLLSKLSGLRRKGAAAAAWGLDLGVAGLRAARLVANGAQQLPTLDATVTVPYPSALTPLTDEAERQRWQCEALRQFGERHRLDTDRICLAVPGLSTLGCFLELPPVDLKKLDETVQAEVGFRFPREISELAWGYYAFPRAAGDGGQRAPHRVLIQAVKKHLVDLLLLLSQDAQLRLDVVQSECLALHNLAMHEFFGGGAPAGAKPASVAILDVGARAAKLVISSPQAAWFRSLGGAGENFTNALVRSFKLTRHQAEQLKRMPTRARRVSQVDQCLEADLNYLVDEVERSVRAYQRQYPGLPVGQLLGLGGGFRLHGLLRRLCRAP